ncbi:hypothetical protein [Nannocystis radixulma]|uniref:Uncharacterized protein n=1 Tax=Nannocystis radixulma TaxID=2995305 RepID=A0ABT5B8Y7_9BACT|nr:hypothetical protein [Nannocystis radixulma]MDC0669471.1 hypothetical protein [Nannocystis radixulma]
MKNPSDSKNTEQNFKVVGELRTLRKQTRRKGAPDTFVGTCQDTGTCCLTSFTSC